MNPEDRIEVLKLLEAAEKCKEPPLLFRIFPDETTVWPDGYHAPARAIGTV